MLLVHGKNENEKIKTNTLTGGEREKSKAMIVIFTQIVRESKRNYTGLNDI